ncbi:MAG: ABC transporter substrate-binding protein, partial [Bradymonadaceae bacterium]
AFAPESGDGPRVLMVRGRAPIVAAGPGSLGAAFIERAGARNVLSGSDTSHPRLDTEKVIELAPEVIVDTTLPSATSSSTFWQDLESVPAVENGRVRRVTTSAALRAGPRIGEGLRAVAEAIYGR